ncbi:putative bifunctional diguanylate cyclase/phosphodiesterase [Methylobacterium sp. J-092]|uniref:putative bifunctional diguanylate cyclase/phosphodiesterase n=1 Tax=Methylobacterium sp. J-092 TaxID=2836667 RepID=UPI001FBB03E1|nr:bifunctional diguanylate cyclase/phosphodiesterase [Methylobacterium sp. J-092]MCJ2010844.1 EAL domain-containing protein [Methylobacterium sp. J-092]
MGRLRARQLEVVDQLAPAMMLANVACAGAFTFLMFEHHASILLTWCSVVTLMSLGQLALSLRANARPPHQTAAARDIHLLSLQTVMMGVCLVSVPVWLMPRVSGLELGCVICLLTGLLWGGSILLATVLPAAVIYIGLVMTATIAGLLISSWDAPHLYLAGLFVIGGGTAIRSVRRQVKQFAAGQRQQYNLEQQGEVIALLLRDYEEQASDWLWETDAEHRCHSSSPRFAEKLARSQDAIDSTSLVALLQDVTAADNTEACDALQAHIEARRPFRDHVVPVVQNGDAYWWSLSGRPLLDKNGTFRGYRGVCADISAAKRAEARVAHLAYYDALTELPNRMLFGERLAQALRGVERNPLAVLSLDLDGFKAVNDRHGHPAGDQLLIAVTDRLQAELDGTDMLARFGGDEFMILDAADANQGSVEALAQRLVRCVSTPFMIGGEDVSIGLSIGIAFAPSDGDTAEELLRNADAALYRSKADGRGTFSFFAPEMDQKLQERQRLVHDLRTALAHGELVLHYQPFVESQTATITGCEALLRWQHPKLGMVSPVDFIPLAESSGLIIPIGAWVIAEACREAASWPVNRRVSVNISAVQFRTRDLPHIILAALTHSGLAPSRLEVEVTEGVLIEDAVTALDILRQIRALGVRIALDDFGTGYSSLSYLRSFAFDKVKIDRSFVKELPSRRDSQVIVQAIRDMAHGLGMTITAEGVETEEQAERLRATGCEELQGYLYSRPKAARDLGRSPDIHLVSDFTKSKAI